MTIFRRLGLAAILLAAAAPVAAGERITGRWAADPAGCWSFGGPAAQSPLVVTNYAVRWHDDSCRITRSYRTGDTIHIQALCQNGRGEHSIPVSLRPHRGRLQLRWDRIIAGDLRRCR